MPPLLQRIIQYLLSAVVEFPGRAILALALPAVRRGISLPDGLS